ncbi:MAG: hypothetical protein IKV25_02235 [Clostridia bacterium]|nr:hypothetical protein [Clostridia bacterium]
MAKNTNSSRRLKGYYEFSKKYPSRRGERPIHESRRAKKRERIKIILFCVFLCCLFVASFVTIKFCYNLSRRPLPETHGDSSAVTMDSLDKLRAVYIDNSFLDNSTEIDQALESASKNGFNAVVLDFKTQEGILTYESDLITYSEKTEYNTISQSIIKRIKDRGFLVVARIFCFEDSIAPQRLNAYVHEDAENTKIWFDDSAINNGKVWLDPTNSNAVSYLTKVVGEVVKAGADCIYLESVQFPASREGSVPVFTKDDKTLNRNLVLMEFLEKAVSSANGRPVILGLPLEAVNNGDAEKWGGTLFDTAAQMCSPIILPPENGDYITYIENNYIVMNDKAKNNFSTVKIIPTVKNTVLNDQFYNNLSSSKAESYIIIP